ncbi:MAG: hypothetical protein GDA48_22350 [Hormoscilla sp. GM102CHS1]|nr:hypothetical protein [Hormoscilla sp. SP12CHS1]MBC6475213.1 hypothetical protein [Hormoscilla sp. GM102CHS1]
MFFDCLIDGDAISHFDVRFFAQRGVVRVARPEYIEVTGVAVGRCLGVTL